MDNRNLIGTAVVWEDEYDGTKKYGRIEHVLGDDGVIRFISREEAGPNPQKVKPRPKF